MTTPFDLQSMWHEILTEFAAGRIDALDLWNAVDEYASTGRPPHASVLPVHRPDVVDVEEGMLLHEQATSLYELLTSFWAGTTTPNDLASAALEVLGLAEDDRDS